MKYSIIVPCYNLERYIGAALDSVLAQTFADYECIVVDDGSVDNSPQVVDEYAARDSRVKVIHKQNGGEGSARNAGLEAAQGEWLAFLDGDDIWNPRTLEMLEFAQHKCPQTKKIRFGVVQFKDGEVCQWGQVDSEPVVREEKFDGIITDGLFAGTVCQHAYRRDVFGDMRFCDYIVGADQEFKDREIVRCQDVTVVEASLYGYRTRPGSIINSKATAAKLTCSVRWRRDRARLISGLQGVVSADFQRRFGRGMVEHIGTWLFDLSKEERDEVRKVWTDALRDWDVKQVLQGWFAFAARIVCALPCDPIVWCLCYVPYRLKQKGFHR